MSAKKPFARRRPRSIVCGVAMWCGALGCLPATADDPKPDRKAALEEQAARVTELEAAVQKADETLVAHAESARTLAAEVSDAGLKARLVVVTGKILEGTRRESVQRPAIQALGALGEPSGFRHLRPFLLPFTLDTLEVIQAASRMRSDESVPFLLAIVRNSQDLGIAVAAIKALDVFGENEATRERIVADLAATVRKDRPGVSYRWGKGGSPYARYEALAGEMLTTLNKLTGQNVASPEDWFDLTEKYKSDLAALFGGRSPAPAAPAVEKASKDLTDEVARLEASVGQHLEGKSDDALVADLGTLAPLAARISEPSVRSRLTDLAGRVLEGTRNPAVQRSAVQALGTLGDPSGFRFVRRLLLLPQSGGGRSLTLEAVDAAARVKSDESVPALLALVTDAEPRVASSALEAFSGFATHKATREKILVFLVDTVKKAKDPPRAPGPPSPNALGPGESYRYQLLSSSLTPTLNAMTGRRLGSPEQWYELVARHKDNLSGLFLDK